MKTRILITNSTSDFSLIQKLAHSGGSASWAAIKDTKAKDRILLYMPYQRRGFVAEARALEDAKPTRDPTDYYHRVKIGKFKLLPAAFSPIETQRKFPKWGWPRYTRSMTTVPDGYANKLWSILHGSPSGKVVAPEGKSSVARKGGGFGDANKNALVEKAAIRLVTKTLVKRGYTVRSRETEGVGYDLDARRGDSVLHVEVKGSAGDNLQFIMTVKERGRAKTDSNLWLFVVTRAGSSRAKVHEFCGNHITRVFAFNPLSYTAKAKAS